MIATSLNLHPDPDMYLPARRARREVAPLLMTRAERELWRKRDVLHPQQAAPPAPRPMPAQAPVAPPPPPSPKARKTKKQKTRKTCRRRRRRGRFAYLVAWRDEFGQTGEQFRVTLEGALQFAEAYHRPRSWALVIDLTDYSRGAEYGSPWAELQRKAVSA